MFEQYKVYLFIGIAILAFIFLGIAIFAINDLQCKNQYGIEWGYQSVYNSTGYCDNPKTGEMKILK